MLILKEVWENLEGFSICSKFAKKIKNNMVISELIKKLEEIQNRHGDVQVRVKIDENDMSIDCVNYGVKNHTLYIEY